MNNNINNPDTPSTNPTDLPPSENPIQTLDPNTSNIQTTQAQLHQIYTNTNNLCQVNQVSLTNNSSGIISASGLSTENSVYNTSNPELLGGNVTNAYLGSAAGSAGLSGMGMSVGSVGAVGSGFTTGVTGMAVQGNSGITLQSSGLGSSGTNGTSTTDPACNGSTAGLTGQLTNTQTAAGTAAGTAASASTTTTNDPTTPNGTSIDMYSSASAQAAAVQAAAAASTSLNPYASSMTSSNPYTNTGINPYAGISTGALSTGLSNPYADPSAFSTASAYGSYGYGGYDMSDGVRRKNATRESTNTLKAWLNEHKKNPYPTKGEKIIGDFFFEFLIHNENLNSKFCFEKKNHELQMARKGDSKTLFHARYHHENDPHPSQHLVR